MTIKDLNKKLLYLEKQAGLGERTHTLILIHFVDLKKDPEGPNVYAREMDGAKVKRQPGETDEAFFQRAKAELLGEDANKDGAYFLFGWNAYPNEKGVPEIGSLLVIREPGTNDN